MPPQRTSIRGGSRWSACAARSTFLMGLSASVAKNFWTFSRYPNASGLRGPFGSRKGNGRTWLGPGARPRLNQRRIQRTSAWLLPRAPGQAIVPVLLINKPASIATTSDYFLLSTSDTGETYNALALIACYFATLRRGLTGPRSRTDASGPQHTAQAAQIEPTLPTAFSQSN